MIAPEACKVRSVAKATRAHSTRARQPVEGVIGSARLAFVAVGDVSTLLRERGCRGVIGADADLRGRVRAVGFVASSFAGNRGGFATCCVFAASPKAFNAALTTCVASTAFSLGLMSFGLWPASPALFVGFFTAAEGFVLPEVWVGFREGLSEGLEASSLSCLPWSSSFKEADIVGVHVETDAMADRIASACVVKEAIAVCVFVYIRLHVKTVIVVFPNHAFVTKMLQIQISKRHALMQIIEKGQIMTMRFSCVFADKASWIITSPISNNWAASTHKQGLSGSFVYLA